MMSRRKTKDVCIKHASRRAFERYGIMLTPEQCNQMSNFIKRENKERAIYVDTRTNRITRWKIWYQDKWIPVAYDKTRGTIVSILPEGSLDENKIECKQCPWIGDEKELEYGKCPNCNTFLGDIIDQYDNDLDDDLDKN